MIIKILRLIPYSQHKHSWNKYKPQNSRACSENLQQNDVAPILLIIYLSFHPVSSTIKKTIGIFASIWHRVNQNYLKN